MKCPKCPKPVLKVRNFASTRLYVHERAGKAEFGCAVSTVKK